MYVNKVERVSLSGGLIGSILTDPRRALDSVIREANMQGWRVVHFDHHRDKNIILVVVRALVLILTAGMWTWDSGYLVIFEKHAPGKAPYDQAGGGGRTQRNPSPKKVRVPSTRTSMPPGYRSLTSQITSSRSKSSLPLGS